MKEYNDEKELHIDYLEYLVDNTKNATLEWKNIKDDNFADYIKSQYNLDNIVLFKGICTQIEQETLCTYLIETKDKKKSIIVQYKNLLERKTTYEDFSNIDIQKLDEIFKYLKLNYKSMNKFIMSLIT